MEPKRRKNTRRKNAAAPSRGEWNRAASALAELDRARGNTERKRLPASSRRATRDSRPRFSLWLVRLASQLGSKLSKTLLPPPRLSAASRQRVNALIARMKADAPVLSTMIAESWLAVERVARTDWRAEDASVRASAEATALSSCAQEPAPEGGTETV
jgi:hypothetical protein